MTVSTSELLEELVRLGPWHMEVEITPGFTTAAYLDAPKPDYPDEFGEVSFYSPENAFKWRLSRMFPNGLEGRRVLDCGCNCGAYLFYAKDLGAGECFGFDAREHWINQARFLAKHRSGPGGDIRFEVLDLYDLPELDLEPFDIAIFQGIFYHLPTPVAGLKIVADMTREFMIVNTATRNGLPDGVLAVSEESKVALNSGIYGLNWFPSGPEVVSRILNWLDFSETRCAQWRKVVPQQPPSLGRLEVFGARDPETFRFFDADLDSEHLIERVRFFTSRAVPEDASVLVAGNHEILLGLGERRVQPFPGVPSGSGNAVERLEELRAGGAQYLVVPASAFEWLEQEQQLRQHLDKRSTLAWEEHGVCLIFLLGEEPNP